MKRFFVVLCLLCALISAHAQGLDDQYVQIYNQIQQADGYLNLGQKAQAAMLYQEALGGLKRIKTMAPKWNEGVVTFRIDYLNEKLAGLRNQPVPATVSTESPAPAASVDWPAQTAALTEKVRALEAEKAELSAKLKEALGVRPATTDASEIQKAQETAGRLQKENDDLKTALEQAKLQAGGSGKSGSKELEAGIEKARKEAKEKYKKEIASLEEKITIDKNEINDLKRRLADAGKNKPARASDKEVEKLRAEIKVYEARAIPLTAEEQAYLKSVEPSTTSVSPAATPGSPTAPADANGAPAVKTKKAHYDLPPGAGPLMADAARDFAARRYEQALKKFLQVLSQDESNLNVLYYVGACQIQLNQRDDANKTIQQALRVDPSDEPALTLLGTIRYQENKYDEAFAALSRAVELDPKDAAAQNLLGATLAQKGQPAAAETALRKALELQPEFADAHFNLALIYIHDKPPYIHLARFHYRKALSIGHRPNEELEKAVGH